MFGKKKKNEEIKKEDEPVTEVSEVVLKKESKAKPVKVEEKKPPVLTEEEKELLERIRAFKRYSGVFSPNDMANIPDIVLRSEEQNLQFAIFAELQDLNRKMEEILKKE